MIFKWKCCGCGKNIVKARGSMKHPYCNLCYNKKFADYREYEEFVNAIE